MTNTIYVRVSGGVVQWIGCDAETFALIGGKFDVTVLCGDNEGTPESELARVEWGGGEVSYEDAYRETICRIPACDLPTKIDYPEWRNRFNVWRLPYNPPQDSLGLFTESELERAVTAPLSTFRDALDSQGYAEINGFRVERDQ